MEQASGPPPPPPEPGADTRPATQEDVRNLRRWIVVAGVWAVAATAVAIIALLNDDEPEKDKTGQVATQVSRLQRQLDERLDRLESRVEELPTSDDVGKLDRRLKEAEDNSSKATADSKSAREKADDLEQRIEDLEQEGGTATTPGGQTP